MAKTKEVIDYDARLLELDKKYSTKNLELSYEAYKARRVYSTGSLAVDVATGAIDPLYGNGGIMAGDSAELYGFNQSLKTAMAHHVALSVQKDSGDNLSLIVAPELQNPKMMENIGLDLTDNKIRILDCTHDDINSRLALAEYQLDAALEYAKDPRMKLLIIDSLAALIPEGQIYDDKGKEKSMDASVAMAIRARLITSFITRFNRLGYNKPTLLMINHFKVPLRTSTFNIPVGESIREATPGGTGKDFLTELRIKCVTKPLAFTHPLLGTKMSDGYEGIFKLGRNRYGNTTNNRSVSSEFSFEKWVDENSNPRQGRFRNEVTALVWGEFLELIEKNGTMYTIGTEKVRGKDAALECLRNNKEVCNEVAKQIVLNGERFFEAGRESSAAVLD